MPRKPTPLPKPSTATKARSKTTPKAPPPSTRKAKANALVEAGRRSEDARAKRGRALVAEIRGHLGTVGDHLLEVGQGLRVLLDEQLFRPLGYDTFEALLAGEQLGSRAQAFKLMGVAEVFAKVGIRDFGIERAAALIAYTRATPEDDDAAELFASDAVIAGKHVRESAVEDLVRARNARLATAPATAAQKAQRAAENAAAKRVAAAHKAAKLPAAEVVVRGGKVIATWSLAVLAPPSDD